MNYIQNKIRYSSQSNQYSLRNQNINLLFAIITKIILVKIFINKYQYVFFFLRIQLHQIKIIMDKVKNNKNNTIYTKFD